MIKIYSSMNGAEVHHFRNVLEGRGIECEVRGEDRRTAMGDLPITECWIELWLVDEARSAEAKALIDGATIDEGIAWTCAGCGETIDGQFDVCWQCGTERAANLR
jgi:hypothetical protein